MLQQAIEIYAGGPGSGCRGPNCGRPSSGKVLIYHGTSDESARKILAEGLRPGPTQKSVYATADKEVALGYARGRASDAGGATEPEYNKMLVGLVVIDPVKSGMSADYSSHYVAGTVKPEAIERVELYRLADITQATGHLKNNLYDAKPIRILRRGKGLDAAGTLEVYVPVLFVRR